MISLLAVWLLKRASTNASEAPLASAAGNSLIIYKFTNISNLLYLNGGSMP